MNENNSAFGPATHALNRLLEEARKKLIETGARNKLVHTPRDAQRSKSIAIVNEIADEIFGLLVHDGESLTFLPAPDEATIVPANKGHSGLTITLPVTTRTTASDSQSDTKLQTRLSPESLQKRLLTLFRDSKTLEEEQGVNVLYLAIGFLRWFENQTSEIVREAPLILVPVTLVRQTARSSFRLSLRDDDIGTNLPLQERMREFGISIPDIPESEEWTPTQYFNAVREAIAIEPRWSIDQNGMMLGFFSFSKLMMFRDLMPENWPAGSILKHPIINDILIDGFPSEEPLFPEEARLDEIFDPANLIHVMDADSSQALVIETVRKGRNLVVQGPPGTGKSQTIANVIAAAVHDGMTVLFVAEKMAALEVVYDRLVKAGLGNVCLELHSRHANKRTVVQEIERTLSAPAIGVSGQKEVDRLREVRNFLNENSIRLHTPLPPSGVTPFRALGDQVKLSDSGYSPPEFSLPGAANWTESGTRNMCDKIGRLAAITKSAGPKDSHPWRGVTAMTLQPADIARLTPKLEALAANTKLVASAVSLIARSLGFSDRRTVGEIADIIQLLRDISDPPQVPLNILLSLAAARDLERLSNVVSTGLEFSRIWDAVGGAFLADAWRADLTPLRQAISAGIGSWFTRLRRPYRAASNELQMLLSSALPKKADERTWLIDNFLQARRLRAEIESHDKFCFAVLGDDWCGLRTNFELLANATGWIIKISHSRMAPVLSACVNLNVNANKVLQILEEQSREARETGLHVFDILHLDINAAFGADHVDKTPLPVLAERTQTWVASIDRLEEWSQLALLDRIVREDGGGPIADRLADGRLEPERAVGELVYARAEALWKIAISTDPKLAELDGELRSRLVLEFQQLERLRRDLVAKEIYAKHKASLPHTGSGMAVIRGEIARQRGHMPIRKLVQRTGKALQQIKPVFLVSPLSAAQFFAPGTVTFDLLVIDEASQVRPEDAIGAIARANQIVVVGDKRQLPPTSFFDRLVDDIGDDENLEEDELEDTPLAGAARATELESILSACEARGMPNRVLTWHYRSRHPSLIEVSNEIFYENRLFLPPSPHAVRERLGFIANRVDGAYDRGNTRTNEIEAQAVVDAVLRHIRNDPDLSLGVVTFSISQRDLIEDLLEVERRKNPELDTFMQDSQREVMFVKNLENVQGDERDVVIISVAYGPRIAASGLDSMHFGPVSTEGGERRLNVLFTRARFRCEVFVSFNSGDIDLARTRKEGARVLKRFLKFAETGQLDFPLPTGGDADSPFEEAVAQAIVDVGYSVDPQVGSGGFKIDLAVKHPNQPGRYILAVECDGATYHSARWARERDRLRQEILEGLGWSFYRIWSTDWFRNPNREKQKLSEAIKRAHVSYS